MSAADRSYAVAAQAPWLNAVRALASFMVCFAHLRAFVLVDYEASGGGPVAQIFYLTSGLHHQAVMIFFVLSGYFVGGALLRESGQRDIDWLAYGVKRAARLWMVLIPALVLTLVWDRLGMALAGPEGYQGTFLDLLSSGPTPDSPADHSLAAFLGNAAFLQTIVVPAYGSNGPLWSLAYEGWYYLLFPLALVTLLPATRPAARVGAVLVLAACMAFLGWRAPAVLVLGLNWLVGVGAYWLGTRGWFAALTGHLVWRAGSLTLLAATLVAARADWWLGHDLLVGFAFAALVPWLARAAMPWSTGRQAAFLSADFSYTLYLVHFPLQAFLFFTLMGGTQLPFGASAMALLIAGFAGCLAYAALVWWLFERNTAWLRRSVLAWLRPGGRIPS